MQLIVLRVTKDSADSSLILAFSKLYDRYNDLVYNCKLYLGQVFYTVS
jgi:hypothetical protein